jgi:hypothetical protein
MHHGFSEAQMREMFVDAGAGTDFWLHVIGGGYIHGHGIEDEEEGGGGVGKSTTASETRGEKGDNSGIKDDKNAPKDKNDALRRQVFFACGTKGGM